MITEIKQLNQLIGLTRILYEEKLSKESIISDETFPTYKL